MATRPEAERRGRTTDGAADGGERPAGEPPARGFEDGRAAAPRPTGRILVADDNEDCRIALRALLEGLGHRVFEAADGDSAVEVARRERPDLVLMDIMMPGVDGLEATRRIRAQEPGAGPGTRIVAVSAMEGAREAGLSAGCDACISKPIDLGELDRMIGRWLSAG